MKGDTLQGRVEHGVEPFNIVQVHIMGRIDKEFHRVLRGSGLSHDSSEAVAKTLTALGPDVSATTAELLPQIYEELRALAMAQFRNEAQSHTLQPTALVHDVYLRMAGSRALQSADRAQLLRVATKLMRHILIDHARRKAAQKRGQGWERLTLTGIDSGEPPSGFDALDLEEALQQLAVENPRRAGLVELRYYGGLTLEEAAESLGISLVTANRDWRLAKAWMARALKLGTTE